MAWCQTLPDLPSAHEDGSGWEALPTHSAERDKADVQCHYDTSNDFFRIWLDPMMVYSCAHFEHPDMSLADAQKSKLDLICRKLRLQPGEDFLDIGCGWGALLRWAVTNYRVRAHGITLSEEQVEFNRKWIADHHLEDKVRVDTLDYRDLPQKPTYDKIASIGMVEHVGIKNYAVYFRSALAALKPGGLFLNHGIGVNNFFEPESRFIRRYIFPDGECVSIVSYLKAAKDAGWEIVDVDAWRPHYAKTLRCWAANLDSAVDEAIALVGNRVVKLWQLYLIVCAQGFENGRNGVYQALLRRAADSHWDLPLRRGEWLC
jgi:cyclopropane-fatty-acyl-phospholipid synthase